MEKSKIFNFLNKLSLVNQENWNQYFDKYCDFKFSRNKTTGLISVKVLINKILPPEILFSFIENLELIDKSVHFTIEYNYQDFVVDDIINYLIFFVKKNLDKNTNKKDYQNLLDLLNYNLKINKPTIENNVV
ncbi:MAG: hypothetical protein K2J02_00625, partial [Malacoplasma sp.]|nr:hypothetical protein [Malacoplasma sp.]